MGLTMYGIRICPDCADALTELNRRGTEYVYKDFSEDTANLKEFLKYRDTSGIFEHVKEEGRIGIPCFVLPDGRLTLSFEEACSCIKD